MDVFSILFTVGMYVLMALGMYTIAKRRGIPMAWLAWVPVVSVWILGAIADDYRARLGKRSNMRMLVTCLVLVSLILAVVVLVMIWQNMFVPIADAVSFEELMQVYGGGSDSVSHMYDTAREEAMAQLEARLDAALTDEMVEQMDAALVPTMALTLIMALTALAALALEYLCWYWLFASCVPAYKLIFFVVSLLFGTQAIFVFMCRDKDLGLPPKTEALPQGNDAPPAW